MQLPSIMVCVVNRNGTGQRFELTPIRQPVVERGGPPRGGPPFPLPYGLTCPRLLYSPQGSAANARDLGKMAWGGRAQRVRPGAAGTRDLGVENEGQHALPDPVAADGGNVITPPVRTPAGRPIDGLPANGFHRPEFE